MNEMSLHEIKACSMSLLENLNQFCKKQNLQYFLCGGTLLGAVRHQGFIPWDDDIDIMMPRKDYERLFEIWPQNTHIKALYHKNTHNFPYAFGKIVDDRTVKTETIRKKFQKIGVDIDIFPIDNIPDDDNEASLFFDNIAKYQYKIDRLMVTYGKTRNVQTAIGNLKTFIIRSLEVVGLWTMDKSIAQLSEYATLYNNKETSSCGITAISHYGINERNNRSAFESSVNVIFEGQEYPAPVGYKTYLSQLYGDNYMQLPPLDKQVTHHSYKAYWK